MTWKMEANEHWSTLKVLCSGTLTADDLTMLAIEASFLVRQHGYMKVLIDLSLASVGFPASKFSALLDIYAEHNLPLVLRSAVLLGSKNAALDLARVLAAAKEYGYPLDVLADRQQAEAWLSQAG